jgi:hypothetical protein
MDAMGAELVITRAGQHESPSANGDVPHLLAVGADGTIDFRPLIRALAAERAL